MQERRSQLGPDLFVYVVPLASRRPALSAAADAGTPGGSRRHFAFRTAPRQLAIKTSHHNLI